MLQTKDQCNTGCLLYAKKFKFNEGTVHKLMCHNNMHEGVVKLILLLGSYELRSSRSRIALWCSVNAHTCIHCFPVL